MNKFNSNKKEKADHSELFGKKITCNIWYIFAGHTKKLKVYAHKKHHFYNFFKP